MKKICAGILATLFGILILLGVMTLTGVISFHELARAINPNKVGHIMPDETVTENVPGVEKALQDIAVILEEMAGNQEAMTSAVAQLTVNLDTSNETFHKEVIALLESKGLHCCCCKCSGEKAPETQAPVVTTCSHANTKYTIGDGVHYKKCTDCGKFIATINCKYNSNGYCYTCGGYRKPAETTAPETNAPTCNHVSTKAVNNGNGTHNVVCNTCGENISTNNCNYTNGNCICGSACSHGSTKAVNNGNGTHNVVCNTCGKTINTVNCTYTNGNCMCGKSCSHTTQLVPNTNDTHSAKCTKCGVTVSTVNCTFDVIYGKCSCGNTEGVIEYGHHTIYVGTDDDEQIIKPNPGSNVIKPNQSDAEQIIKPNPGSNVIKPNQSDAEQIIKPNPGSNVIKPNTSNNDKDYTCTDPIRPDGGQIIIKPNPGSGSNIIAPNPTN